MAFDVRSPPGIINLQYGHYLECAIVRGKGQESDPPYKIEINLRINDGQFEGIDVTYTLVSGRRIDRSDQYKTNVRVWTSMPRTKDWYWSGERGRLHNVGHLYHNDKDGWMYSEAITSSGSRHEMRADCHSCTGRLR